MCPAPVVQIVQTDCRNYYRRHNGDIAGKCRSRRRHDTQHDTAGGNSGTSLWQPLDQLLIYLSNSFIPCALQLIIFSDYSLLIPSGNQTRKLDTLDTGCRRLYSKSLLRQTYSAISDICHRRHGHARHALRIQPFPLNGSTLGMVTAMLLFIAASQAFALTICSIIPNLRFALSILTYRHTVVLDSRLLISRRADVWRRRHILLYTAYPLLFSYIYQHRAQRL